MEWIALITWVLVVAFALPLARGAAEYPLLGVAPLAAVAGLALCIVFLAVGGSTGVAWGAFAAAIVGLVCVGLSAVYLTSDRHPVANAVQQGHEESEAAFAGLELELFGLVSILALLTALGVATLN